MEIASANKFATKRVQVFLRNFPMQVLWDRNIRNYVRNCIPTIYKIRNISLHCHKLKAKIRISTFFTCLVLIFSVNPELETVSASLESQGFLQFSWKPQLRLHDHPALTTAMRSLFCRNCCWTQWSRARRKGECGIGNIIRRKPVKCTCSGECSWGKTNLGRKL